MKTKEQKTALIMSGVFSLTYILSFLLYYVSTYVSSSAAVYFISSYFGEITGIIISSVTVMLMFVAYCDAGWRRAVIRGTFYSLCTLLYSFPYYTFEHAVEGHEISAVLLFSMLESLLFLVLTFIKYLGLFFLMIFVMRIFGNRKISDGYDIRSSLYDRCAFDFSSPLSIGIFSSALAVFIYKLAFEIFDTVKFLLNYSESYTAGEILLMLFRYIFILAMLLISQYVAFFVKNIFIKKTEKEL